MSGISICGSVGARMGEGIGEGCSIKTALSVGWMLSAGRILSSGAGAGSGEAFQGFWFRGVSDGVSAGVGAGTGATTGLTILALEALLLELLFPKEERFDLEWF